MAKPKWADYLCETRSWPNELSEPEPCRCFYPFERAIESQGGPFSICLDGSSIVFGSIDLAGRQLCFCPECGGRVECYRPEVVGAHATYRAARESFGMLRPFGHGPGHESLDEVLALCRSRGAAEVGESDAYQRVFEFAESRLRVIASWDPDHECYYSSCSFSPGEELERRPFISQSFSG